MKGADILKEQIIVTIGRENGSAGHLIAQMIAEQLQIKLYDKNILDEAVGITIHNAKLYHKADEKPVNLLLSRRIGEHSNSIEAHIAQKTFDFIRSKASSGESFVVVGRCADYVLRENPNTVRIFISGDYDEKVKRMMETHGVSENKAADMMRKMDQRRRTYHNYFCDTKWGDSRHYDILINSSRLGISKTTDVLLFFVRAFIEN